MLAIRGWRPLIDFMTVCESYNKNSLGSFWYCTYVKTNPKPFVLLAGRYGKSTRERDKSACWSVGRGATGSQKPTPSQIDILPRVRRVP